jgi:hypothetical protein
MNAPFSDTGNNIERRFARARARYLAWCRVLEATGEMRGALDYRISREDPDDEHLEADCRTWCQLATALADFLRARRSA